MALKSRFTPSRRREKGLWRCASPTILDREVLRKSWKYYQLFAITKKNLVPAMGK